MHSERRHFYHINMIGNEIAFSVPLFLEYLPSFSLQSVSLMMTSENPTNSISQFQSNTDEAIPTNSTSQAEKPLPQTPKSGSNRFSKTLPEPAGSNASKADGNAPRSVRVVDIKISPKTPSTKKKGSKNRQGRISSPRLVENIEIDKPFKHPPVKRRSSSISSFSHTSQKDVTNPPQGDTVKVYPPPRRNRQSTLTQEQKVSYLSLQENDDKENDVPGQQNFTLAKAKGTWAGWMKSGQLLRPRLSKDSDVFVSDAESKKSDTPNELNSVRESIRAIKNSNTPRAGRHQRNKASTTHAWTTNEDNKSKKTHDGPRKIAASHFKSPELEGRSTFGNRRKRASIGVILAPAFEQQKSRSTTEGKDEDDEDLQIGYTSTSGKSNIDHENLKKALNPKRDLTSIFDKKRRKPIGSPSTKSETIMPAAIQHIKEPITSHPVIQATLAGLGIFGTPPTNSSIQEVSSSALTTNKQGTPSTAHLSPLLGSELYGTPEANNGIRGVPKIIITPPVPPSRLKGNIDIAQPSRAGNYFQTITAEKDASEDAQMASGLPVPNQEASKSEEEQKDPASEIDNEVASLPLEHELPSFDIQEKRTNDDNKGIESIKIVIDAFLSDFFVERPYDHTRRLFPSLTDLLISSMEPGNHFELSKWGRTQPIPSLRAHCTAVEGEEIVILHPRWVRWKMQNILDIILDHIITGVIALVVDDRAPYGTPPVMAGLIDSLIQNLITPEDIHLTRSPSSAEMNRTVQDNALGTWVQMCAIAVGLGSKTKDYFTVADLIQMNTFTIEEKEAWKLCLKGIDPANRLVILLRRHINVVLERGKATRERNNLLVVPPVQRGSRKRWLAANAEQRARRASHDENFAKLTSGQISEGEYRSTERRLAAEGHPRDIFAALHLVRFVGELYRVSVITNNTLREWLDRFLFDTVFPGVPSLYELEAGCALLLTVGRTIEEQSGKRCSSSSSPEQAQSPSFLRMDVASSPIKATIDLMKMDCKTADEEGDDEQLSWSIVEQCIARLQEIQQIEEVNEEGKIWCREMVAMHQRGWQRAGPSESHMNAVSSAAQAARRARRGPHRNRQQQQQQQQRTGRSTTTPSIPTRQSPVRKGGSRNNQEGRAQSNSDVSNTTITVQDYTFEDE